MKKRIKTGGALILAAVLVVSAFVIPKAFAAIGVNVDADCKLTVDTTGTGYKELTSDSVIVNLYRVADIAVTGAYNSLLEGVTFSDINSESAAVWDEKAALVVENLGDMEVTATAKTDGGVVTFEGLETGLYLVYAEQMLSAHNQYDFKPYLISLPNNYWNNSAKDNEIPDSAKDEEGNVTDEWIYNFTVSLKPSKTDRYGDLVINKTLDAYNSSVGGATFVFEVKAVKTDVDTKEETVVYNDVVSMTFDKAGSKQVIIRNIEAGAVVTVTEVYSGASYELVADNGETQIIAEDIVNVSFENTYDDGLNGGNGLVNTFTKLESGEFNWAGKADDSTSAEIIAKIIEE